MGGEGIFACGYHNEWEDGGLAVQDGLMCDYRAGLYWID